MSAVGSAPAPNPTADGAKSTASEVAVLYLSGEVEGVDEVLRGVGLDPMLEPILPSRLGDVLRQSSRLRGCNALAVVGEPARDEIGYWLAPLLALALRPRTVVTVDIGSRSCRTQTLAHYVRDTLPFAALQLSISTAGLALQLGLVRLLRSSRRVSFRSPHLSRVVYVRTLVGRPSAVGGGITHTHEVIRALRQVGVGVASFTPDAQLAATAANDVPPPCSWRVTTVPSLAKAAPASMGAVADLVLSARALRTARSADVVYQRHSRFSVAGAVLGRLTRRPLFLEYNGSEVWVAENWTTTSLRGHLRRCEEAILNAATRVIVVADPLREELVERGIAPERIVVNPNGVNAARFGAGGGAAVRRRLGISEGEPVVGFLGTFGPWHGVPVLARAFPAVLERAPSARLLLIGTGPEHREVRRLVVAAGVEQRVVFVDAVPPAEVPSFLDACDVLASPHIEMPGREFFGSPTKLFEYLASGRPVVASSLGQIAELLDDDRTALLVPPGDIDALAAAIVRLIDDPDLRARIGAAARARALERHTWIRNVERVVDEYARVAAVATREAA